MTTTVTFTYGSTTVSLSSGYSLLNGFYPTTPENGRNAVDTIEVFVQGSSVSDLESKVRALQTVITRVKEYRDNNASDKVYVNCQLDGSSGSWRALVVDGAVNIDRSLAALWPAKQAKVAIIIEHLDWEGSLTQISLTNDNGTDDTAGLTVFNCADASGASPNKRVNYVEIAAAKVLGDLPTPCKLILENTTNSANKIMAIWAGLNVNSSPATFNGLLEAESATGETPIVDATSSGGNYAEKTLPTDGETTLFTWAIPAATVDLLNGHFMIMARFAWATNITEVRFRPKLLNAAVVSEIYTGEQILPDDNYGYRIRDLGVIKLPPWNPKLGSQGALNLRLTGERIEAVTKTISLDCLHLLPVHDGYRHYWHPYGVPYQSFLIDDGIEDYIYTEDASHVARDGAVIPTGNILMLQPGKLQRLYFWQHTNALNTAPITDTMKVKLYYRPRKRSL